MNYPNKINKVYEKNINYGNRGMDLESIINDTNEYLKEKDIAIIYKKPTPIGIVKTTYVDNKEIINKAYFKEPSQLDYCGIYKGCYIEFDAKNTNKKTSFPLSNIHKHQILHIKNIIRHQGIAFLIIRINEEYYLLNGANLLDFINNNERKSIPYDYFKDNAYKLDYNYNKGLNYIDYVEVIRRDYEKSKN